MRRVGVRGRVLAAVQRLGMLMQSMPCKFAGAAGTVCSLAVA